MITTSGAAVVGGGAVEVAGPPPPPARVERGGTSVVVGALVVSGTVVGSTVVVVRAMVVVGSGVLVVDSATVVTGDSVVGGGSTGSAWASNWNRIVDERPWAALSSATVKANRSTTRRCCNNGTDRPVVGSAWAEPSSSSVPEKTRFPAESATRRRVGGVAGLDVQCQIRPERSGDRGRHHHQVRRAVVDLDHETPGCDRSREEAAELEERLLVIDRDLEGRGLLGPRQTGRRHEPPQGEGPDDQTSGATGTDSFEFPAWRAFATGGGPWSGDRHGRRPAQGSVNEPFPCRSEAVDPEVAAQPTSTQVFVGRTDQRVGIVAAVEREADAHSSTDDDRLPPPRRYGTGWRSVGPPVHRTLRSRRDPRPRR